MTIYHYTSLDTLSLILKNKTIRFNRLDRVDDPEEASYGSGSINTKLGRYIFVSCWTKAPEENERLWDMYTHNKGVRIGMDEDMFVHPQMRKIGPYSKVPITLTKDFFTFDLDRPIVLYDVIYVDDMKERVKNYITEEGKYLKCIIKDLGLYKSTQWNYQNESRFKIVVYPIQYSPSDRTNNYRVDLYNYLFSLLKAIKENKPLKTPYIDYPLNPDKLNLIEVMMGPQTSEQDRRKVEELLKDYPQSTILQSNL